MKSALAALKADLEIAPDPLNLFRLLAGEMSAEMVWAIARADYSLDDDRHQAALAAMIAAGSVPEPWPRHPGRVLEALRWLEPDATGWSSGRTGRDGHVMRAFSCATLLIAGARASGAHLRRFENVTVVQLIASVLALGQAYARPAAELLTWRLADETIERPEPGERPFFLLGLLVLLRLSPAFSVEDRGWRALASWMADTEAEARAALRPSGHAPWVGGLTSCTHRINVWTGLARRAFLDRTPPGADQLRGHLSGWLGG